MDLWFVGWYASVENTKNGGDCNERIVEDVDAAASDSVGYCHWDMPFLLHLFSDNSFCCVECFVPAFNDSAYYRTRAGRSLGDGWSVSHITPWTSEGSRLANRQDE